MIDQTLERYSYAEKEEFETRVEYPKSTADSPNNS